jgi:hypothetical protein
MQRTGEVVREYLPTTLSAQNKTPLEDISKGFFVFSLVQTQTDLHSVRKIQSFIAADRREIWYTVP